MNFWEFVLHYLSSERFVTAAGMTLLISLCSLAGGMLAGLVVALLQEVRFLPARILAVFYLWIFRGTPVMFQLIFAFNVLPSFGIVLSGFACAVLALSLNEGAYMAEIMRSGIRAVGAGQRQAARALGMRDMQLMRWVVLPQAMRIIVPPIGNQFIGMLKLSAIVSVIAVEELLLVANQAASSNFRYLEALSAAGIYYLAMTTVFMVLQALLEATLRRRGRPMQGGLLGRFLSATADGARVR
ncbi:amino acid ABC transporter permease [Neoroseomonas lacus]|uniref:Amino acid ABC transporter n=1 Tax=Neoroseomonas lacus TaxID=287609 RepID=A0A917KKH6_9PROT|nr:amino acid ABC transporter permease [Neoroseomonas lacus]GGJ18261.1 amino acid ABC transporter [Neoroseomonas lacus]